MTRLAPLFRTSGLVLTVLGMVVLILTGGLFSHAHEVAPIGQDHHLAHDHVSDAAHHHQHENSKQGKSDGPLHCGAPILTLVTLQVWLPTDVKVRMARRLVSDLIPRSLSPEPPPPRLA